MEKTVTFSMTENQAKEMESLLDKTLYALKRLEEDGPKRDVRVDELQMQTAKKLDAVEIRLKEISKIHAEKRSFTEIGDWR